jgi:transcriptional regulator GlxA family with amidase domain
MRSLRAHVSPNIYCDGSVRGVILQGCFCQEAKKMIDVTVLYCADGYVSTSIAPLEIFHSAGLMWNMCVGRPAEPYFRITTASVDGAAVTCGAGVQVLPDKPLAAVEKTDLVFVPTAGMNVDILLAQNAAAIPWLQRLHAEGTLIAGVCTGVAILAEAGLLDGRRATTHWAVAELYRRRFPKVDWQTHLCITEDRGVLCGGGLYASDRPRPLRRREALRTRGRHRLR